MSKLAHQKVIFAYPGDLESPTGGYAYDRRIIEELRQCHWDVELLSLGEGFPLITSQVRSQVAILLRNLPPHLPIIMDGLALGVLPESIAQLCLRNPVIALIHHPLACESGLDAQRITQLLSSETAALKHVTQVIVNSQTTANILVTSLAVPVEHITIAHPGTDRVAQARVRLSSVADTTPLQLLSVGSIIPRKAYATLVAALAPLHNMAWNLTIAGDTLRDPACCKLLFAAIAHAGLQDRIHVLGAVSDAELQTLYQKADAYVLASLFEGYGMAYAQALAYGLPIIGTTGGAIPEVLGEGAALLVEPGDIMGLTQALRMLMEDQHCRLQLGKRAFEMAQQQPTWAACAQKFVQVLKACR